MSYRAILPDGEIRCDRYAQVDAGIEAYDEDGEMIAFVPYPNLVAIINEDVETDDDRSTW